jgi:peroxiredoxin (alkyl hydroperoxide reductase subunit C)
MGALLVVAEWRQSMSEQNSNRFRMAVGICVTVIVVACLPAAAPAQVDQQSVYDPGKLKARDSGDTIQVGQPAPEFTLPSVHGEQVALADFRGDKNVVISFVPAAWTPVCSQQWPGYNIAEQVFEKHNAVLLGISVDNIPTLYAWTQQMGDLWFPVLSDFWPHGAVAKKFGVLRSDGVAERSTFVIDTKGIVRYGEVHDINEMPRLDALAEVLQSLDGADGR